MYSYVKLWIERRYNIKIHPPVWVASLISSWTYSSRSWIPKFWSMNWSSFTVTWPSLFRSSKSNAVLKSEKNSENWYFLKAPSIIICSTVQHSCYDIKNELFVWTNNFHSSIWIDIYNLLWTYINTQFINI